MINKNIVFVLYGNLDIFFLNTILEKLQNRNYNYYFVISKNLINNKFIDEQTKNKKNNILFVEPFNINIYSKFKNLYKIWKKIFYDRVIIKKFLPNEIERTYVFNAFNNSLTFTILPLLKKIKFIQSNAFLKNINLNNNFKHVNQFNHKISKKKIFHSILNFFVFKLLFLCDLKLSKYIIDENYLKKKIEIENDYLKVTGIGVKDKFKELRIKASYNFKKVDKPKNEILFLYTRFEDENGFGIDYDKTYRNVFNYLKRLNLPITLKLHPSYLDNFDYSKIEKFKLKVKIIDDHNPAEKYLPEYKNILCPVSSRSFYHFVKLYDFKNYNLISCIDMIEYKDDNVKKKFEQYFLINNLNIVDVIDRPKN